MTKYKTIKDSYNWGRLRRIIRHKQLVNFFKIRYSSPSSYKTERLDFWFVGSFGACAIKVSAYMVQSLGTRMGPAELSPWKRSPSILTKPKLTFNKEVSLSYWQENTDNIFRNKTHSLWLLLSMFVMDFFLAKKQKQNHKLHFVLLRQPWTALDIHHQSFQSQVLSLEEVKLFTVSVFSKWILIGNDYRMTQLFLLNINKEQPKYRCHEFTQHFHRAMRVCSNDCVAMVFY